MFSLHDLKLRNDAAVIKYEKEQRRLNSTKVISCEEAINAISKALMEASGERITEIYGQIVNHTAIYTGDSVITVTN